MQSGINHSLMEEENLSGHGYPQNLSPAEISSPMMVIEAFFDDDWLPGHMRELKEWRMFMIEETYFKDGRGSPASLLYIHKLNIKLIEAVFLMLQKQRNEAMLNEEADEDQLEREKDTWRDYPVNLNRQELLDPYLVLYDFFSKYNLFEYQEHLYTWLECALSAGDTEEYDITPRDIVYIYENLQKLYEACWVLRQRAREPMPVSQSGPDALPISMRLHLDILSSMIGPERIFLISRPDSNNSAYNLLLIIPESNKTPFKEMESVINLTLYQSPPLYITLLKAASLSNYLHQGHIFYSFNCRTENMIFNESQSSLLITERDLLEKLISQARAGFELLFSKARQFKNMADQQRSGNDSGLTAYLLQQATELSFKAVIMALFGYDPRIHSLQALKKYNQNHLACLNRIFPQETEEDIQLLRLLEDAYANGRYSTAGFSVPDEQLEILFERVERLHEEALRQFEEKLREYEDMIFCPDVHENS